MKYFALACSALAFRRVVYHRLLRSGELTEAALGVRHLQARSKWARCVPAVSKSPPTPVYCVACRHGLNGSSSAIEQLSSKDAVAHSVADREERAGPKDETSN